MHRAITYSGHDAGDILRLGKARVGAIDLGKDLWGDCHRRRTCLTSCPGLNIVLPRFCRGPVGPYGMGRATKATVEESSNDAEASADDESLLALLAAGLRLQSTDTLWRVSGNTIAHRSLLRDAGGTWNRIDQCWDFTGEDPTTKLAAALEAQPPVAGHNSGEAAPDKPHYWGHRGRVRARVLKAGIEPLADYELLELILFYAIERIDTKPLAKRLIERFGTLGDVFAAEAAQLREFEIDQRTLVLFRAMRESGRRLAERKVKNMPVLTNWQQLIDYCHAALAHEKTEQFRILFLDRKNVLIADEVQQRGTIDHTPVYPREVVKRALELGAAALILVHNHPSGDPKPSRDDIEMTKEIRKAAEALGISIHDHLVIGRKGHASFRSLGLLA
jgi:DNA repair protein RadC